MWPAGLVSSSRDGLATATRFSLNLSSLCVTDLTAVAIHHASTTAAAVLSGNACSRKPPFTGHFCGTGICESPGRA